MANFTKLVQNTVDTAGSDPPSVWGTMLWGELWQYGSKDLIVDVGKWISNAISSDSVIRAGILYFSDIINTQEITTRISVTLMEKNGYFVTLPPTSSYAATSPISTNYATTLPPTTVWS